MKISMDSLQWEVNRLDAENQKLRSQDPDGSDRVDLEAEWKQAQDDVGGLTEQLKNCQQRVTHSEREVTEAQERAAEAQQQAAIDLQRATEAEQQCQKAEQRLTSLEQETQQLQEAHHHMSEELGEANHRVEQGQAETRGLRVELVGVEEDLAVAEERVGELSTTHEAEKQAMHQDAMISRYKALEEEQRKWEAREARLVGQLESGGNKSFDVEKAHLERELAEARALISDSEDANASLKLRVEELEAELVFVQTKLRRVEFGSARVTKGIEHCSWGLGWVGR